MGTRTWRTVADLLRDLGDVPAERVLMQPLPGTATEADTLWAGDHDCLCELVAGTLVAKRSGCPGSVLSGLVVYFLMNHTRPNRLGPVSGPSGPYRMRSGNVRLPDVAFTARHRIPVPVPQIADWCPDFCIEVIDPTNTPAELVMKRADLFESGCRRVWEIDPATCTGTDYHPSGLVTTVEVDGVLEAADVLPGFRLPLGELFREYRIALNLE